jgi:hypothetical protein
MPDRSSLNRHYGQRPDCRRCLQLTQTSLHRHVKAGQEDSNEADSGVSDSDAMDFEATRDYASSSSQPLPPPLPSSRSRRSVSIEEVEDDDNQPQADCWSTEYEGAAAPLGEADVPFEHRRQAQEAAGQQPWFPFESREEWEFGEWIMQSGVSQSSMDRLLNLDYVSCACTVVSPYG